MITIRHTHADGTLLEGSRKSDGVYEILKGLGGNWRYFPSIRQIGIGQSRDKNAQTWKINAAAGALRTAGFDVTVVIDEDDRRTFAEAEADRYERAEDRALRMSDYSDRAADRSNALGDQAHRMAEAIPFGQPMMPDHHSYGRDRRYRDRIHALQGKSINESKKADYYAHRAENAENMQAYREDVPTTLRRIEKLEAEQRRLQRRLDGTGLAMHGEDTPATGGYAERLARRIAGITEEIAYWQGIVAKAQDSGAKIWSRADFTKGDYVRFLGSWYEVLRVSAKSVTIPAMINQGAVITKAGARCTWTDTVPYHKVTGRKSADEIAELLASA